MTWPGPQELIEKGHQIAASAVAAIAAKPCSAMSGVDNTLRKQRAADLPGCRRNRLAPTVGAVGQYLRTSGLTAGGSGAIGEIWNVTQLLQPFGRFSVSISA